MIDKKEINRLKRMNEILIEDNNILREHVELLIYKLEESEKPKEDLNKLKGFRRSYGY